MPPRPICAVSDISDNSIIAVSGILGLVTEEDKMVHDVPKKLTCMHLADSTGRLVIRTWNHPASAFSAFVDQPLLVRRIRITSFGGVKLGEVTRCESESGVALCCAC